MFKTVVVVLLVFNRFNTQIWWWSLLWNDCQWPIIIQWLLSSSSSWTEENNHHYCLASTIFIYCYYYFFFRKTKEKKIDYFNWFNLKEYEKMKLIDCCRHHKFFFILFSFLHPPLVHCTIQVYGFDWGKK